jgi:uncharacterized membrane protein YidH (DUF202 family)
MFSQDMTKNNCPYCNTKISYWDKLKPVVGFNEQFVLCGNCHKKISEHWVNKGIGVGWALGAIAFARLAAKSENPFAYFLAFIAVVLIIFMLAATKVELKQCNELTFKEVRAEYMAKETSVNFVRVALIVVASVAGFALFIWFIGHG